MFRILKISFIVFVLSTECVLTYAQNNLFSLTDLKEDFTQFRNILEKEHCCLYEYTHKSELDSLFDAHYQYIKDGMELNSFFLLLAPVTAKTGCMHTGTWMPGRFFVTKPAMMFPLTVKLIDDQVVVSGSYLPGNEVLRGSILLEINKRPIEDIIGQFRTIISADALNPYFIDAQIAQRFSLLFASVYGLPDFYEIKYLSPGEIEPITQTITPADHESVRKVVFAHFSSPALGFYLDDGKKTAIMTVSTFIYYDKVDYFRRFMDSCFHLIRAKEIDNLILDVRGNGGGDPFCSSILLSYLQKSPVAYFAEDYDSYSALAKPLPIPENKFTGNLYILIDGGCGSTNGHFCALLKYNKLGKFIGTPAGSTYKCNAGRNTEFRLDNTQMIITIGRSTYAAAVKDMVKSAIVPDILVHETYDDFLNKRDVYLDEAFKQIEIEHR